MDASHRAVELLRRAERVVVFTGAGVSAESGINTFRDADGLWRHFSPEVFAEWSGLMEVATNEPHRAAQFVLALVEPILMAGPNAAHRAIAALERHAQVTVVTQNIDGLHEAAGSSAVRNVHGTLYETALLDGQFHGRIEREELGAMAAVLRPLAEGPATFESLLAALAPLMGVDERGLYRPRIVMFGDMLAEPDWTLAKQAAQACDLMLSVGTSGEVYPAAMLPAMARDAGAPVIGIDPDHIDCDIWLGGKAGEILPGLLAAAFGQQS